MPREQVLHVVTARLPLIAVDLDDVGRRRGVLPSPQRIAHQRLERDLRRVPRLVHAVVDEPFAFCVYCKPGIELAGVEDHFGSRGDFFDAAEELAELGVVAHVPDEHQDHRLILRRRALERLARVFERGRRDDLERVGTVGEEEVAPAREVLLVRLDEEDEWTMHARALCEGYAAATEG